MPEYLKPDTPAEAIERFRFYRGRIEALRSSRLLTQGKVPNRLSVNWDFIKKTERIEHQAPDDETVTSFATQIRPFILDRDAVSHLHVRAEAARYITHPGLLSWCQVAKEEYVAIMANPLLMGPAIYLADNRIMKPKEIFELFMNAEGPHVFADAAGLMEEFGRWRVLAKMGLVSLCLNLYVLPFQCLADTLGIALGDLEPRPGDLDAHTEERLENARRIKAQGQQVVAREYDDASPAPWGSFRFRKLRRR